jgi:hypothetical protein
MVMQHASCQTELNKTQQMPQHTFRTPHAMFYITTSQRMPPVEVPRWRVVPVKKIFLSLQHKRRDNEQNPTQ